MRAFLKSKLLAEGNLPKWKHSRIVANGLAQPFVGGGAVAGEGMNLFFAERRALASHASTLLQYRAAAPTLTPHSKLRSLHVLWPNCSGEPANPLYRHRFRELKIEESLCV